MDLDTVVGSELGGRDASAQSFMTFAPAWAIRASASVAKAAKGRSGTPS
jgi:hypothetical protein